MLDPIQKQKRVIIHLGPHKTGTTALQQCLSENQKALAQAGILFLHNNQTHSAALKLAREKYKIAEEELLEINKIISDTEADTIILSQEDFCGALPGSNKRSSIYPNLTKNLNIIFKSLRPHKLQFIFFERSEERWLFSCYHQHLKYRTRFSNIDDFREYFADSMSWRKLLEEPKRVFGENLIIQPYSVVHDAGVSAILKISGKPNIRLSKRPLVKNASPTADTVRILERINTLSGFKSTAWFSKSLVMKDWRPKEAVILNKPVFSTTQELATFALPELTKRAQSRISFQDIEDILPPQDVDLTSYVFDLLPQEVRAPTVSRQDIKNQSQILDYHLRGKSQLAKLNALTISYLRRDTNHTDKARALFHRIWREQGVILVNELTTRWLISTLQTFLDHGESEAQRIIGASGHFYANMMKIYEGERSIEGRAQDSIYESVVPQTPNKFGGLDRYRVGGTDLLLNTNALALDLAMRDDVAGLVLTELLLRVKASANVFTRMDRTRKEKGISEPEFSDTWSFFEPR